MSFACLLVLCGNAWITQNHVEIPLKYRMLYLTREKHFTALLNRYRQISAPNAALSGKHDSDLYIPGILTGKLAANLGYRTGEDVSCSPKISISRLSCC